MSKTSSSFKQTDVTRALKGARAAGLEVARVEIEATGKIVLVATSEQVEPSSAFEKWKQGHARTS